MTTPEPPLDAWVVDKALREFRAHLPAPALLGLDLKPEQHEAPMIVNVNTALPPEVTEVIDEDGPGELGVGEAG